MKKKINYYYQYRDTTPKKHLPKTILLLFDKITRLEKEGKIYINPREPNKIVKFIEGFCRHTKGDLTGKLIKLELWQKSLITLIYGTHNVLTREKYFNEAFIGVGRGNGKDLELNTLIPTPDGFTKMKDLKIGDYVFSDRGEQIKVLAKSEVFTKKLMKVFIDKNEPILAGPTHQWEVEEYKYVKGSYNKGKIKNKYQKTIYTTEELKERVEKVRKSGSKNGFKIKNSPVKYNHKKLPIDPYILGYWLGDGDKSKGNVVVWNKILDEMIEIFKSKGYSITSITKNGSYSCSIITLNYKGTPLRTLLRENNLLNNKHIPQEYIYNSIKNRQELVRGLMDSDGSIDKRGICVFTQKNKDIINNFNQVLWSLGIKNNLIYRERYDKRTNKKYYLYTLNYISYSFNPFNLKYKAERVKEKYTSKVEYSFIKKVEWDEGIKQSQCIQVEGGLYKTSKNFITTHNSSLSSCLALYDFIFNKGSEVVISANTREQAKLVFNDCKNIIDSDIELKQVVKEKRAELETKDGLNRLFKISADARFHDGLNPSLVIYDEIHAAKKPDLYNVLKSSQVKRTNKLFINITTAGFQRGSIYDTLYDRGIRVLEDKEQGMNGFLPILYEIDKKEDYDKESEWIKANPNVGISVKLDYLKQELENTKGDDMLLNNFLTKYCMIPRSSTTGFIQVEDMRLKCPGTFNYEDFKGSIAIIGVDLSKSDDLTSITFLFFKENEDKIYLKNEIFMTEDMIEKGVKQGIPYDIWLKQGLINPTQGQIIDYGEIAKFIIDIIKKYELSIYTLAYDKWNALDFIELLKGLRNEAIPQNLKTLSEPMKTFKRYLDVGWVNYDNNPIMEWTYSNVRVWSDVNGNIRPNKDSDSKLKIDPFMSSLNAFVIFNRDVKKIKNIQRQNKLDLIELEKMKKAGLV